MKMTMNNSIMEENKNHLINPNRKDRARISVKRRGRSVLRIDNKNCKNKKKRKKNRKNQMMKLEKKNRM